MGVDYQEIDGEVKKNMDNTRKHETGEPTPLRRGGLGGGRFAPAQAADVVSSNIVGYNKITLTEGYNLVGGQFVEIGGANRDLSTSFILDDSFAGYDAKYKFKTRLQVWNGGGYDTYGWAGDSGTEVDDDPSLDYTWTDLGAEAVEDEVPPTEGVWIIAEKAGVATVSGEVVTTNVTINLVSGYNLVCNPYPMEMPITSFGRLDDSFAGYDSKYKFKTRLQVWNGGGYDTYGWAGDSGTEVDDDPSLDYTWTDLGAEATNAKIPTGAAVWIIAEKSGTITFTSPVKE